MPLNITHPNEIAFLKGLIYAPNGRGKTTFCGTAALDERTSPTLMIDFRGNMEVLYGLDVDIVKVRSIDELSQVHAFLLNDNQKQQRPYKCVCLDSLSELSTELLDIERKRRVALGGKGREETPDQAQLQDYGAILVQTRRILRWFYDLPIHCLYTAFEYVEAEPGEGLVKKPSMEGRMRNEAGGLMTVVGYLTLDLHKKNSEGEPERVLFLRDFPDVRVKARTPWGQKNNIPRVLENPTVSRLLNVCFPKPQIVTKEQAS